MFMWILTAKARAKSVTRLFLDLGPRHFLCRFSHDVALVTCPCAFRLCRLAQSVWLALAGLHFPRQAQELFRTSLHDLAWILMRWSCGDLIPLYEVLAWSCTEVLHRRSCMKGDWRLSSFTYQMPFASFFLRGKTSRICTFFVDFEDPHAIGHGRWKPSFCIID